MEQTFRKHFVKCEMVEGEKLVEFGGMAEIELEEYVMLYL